MQSVAALRRQARRRRSSTAKEVSEATGCRCLRFGTGGILRHTRPRLRRGAVTARSAGRHGREGDAAGLAFRSVQPDLQPVVAEVAGDAVAVLDRSGTSSHRCRNLRCPKMADDAVIPNTDSQVTVEKFKRHSVELLDLLFRHRM